MTDKSIEDLFRLKIAKDPFEHVWCYKHREIMFLKDFRASRYDCIHCKQAIYNEGDCDPL